MRLSDLLWTGVIDTHSHIQLGVIGQGLSAPEMTHEILDKITFGINSQTQDEAETAAECFYGRAPRIYLPISIKRFVDHQQLIERRKQKQIEITRRKGRSSPTDYKPGDKVLIRDHYRDHYREACC